MSDGQFHNSHPVIQRLLGCGWGRSIGTDDDPLPCLARAVQIVMLHNGPEEFEVRLCERHVEAIKRETTPHI